ncbi:MAG: hypothetical protein AB2705_03130 [Candidatus Thiodiazotropha sp.]
MNTVDSNVNDIFNMLFTEYELYKSIKTLKLGRSGGPDGIVAEMITETVSTIAPVLLMLYNKILVTGKFLNNWSQSIICPIFKTGSLSNPNNFRGISLIDVFNKIITGMMNNRIYTWAEDFSKIDEAQAG